ncbi:hypothetical protein P4S72_16290 [Vibrio sp. PP-XX7]
MVDVHLRHQFAQSLRFVLHCTVPHGILRRNKALSVTRMLLCFFKMLITCFMCIASTVKTKRIAWAHVSSPDLVNWTEHPVALTPSDWFDSHGVYSGHAVQHDDQLMVFYTGNVRIGEQRQRMTYQCLATSTDGLNFYQARAVIETLPPNVTAHCRDPKVLRHGDHWLMFLGAQLTSGLGRLASYRSEDLINWEFSGIYGNELGDFGYMWECPDLIEVDGQLLAIICPQGIPSNSPHYQIPHHNGYLKSDIECAR